MSIITSKNRGEYNKQNEVSDSVFLLGIRIKRNIKRETIKVIVNFLKRLLSRKLLTTDLFP